MNMSMNIGVVILLAWRLNVGLLVIGKNSLNISWFKVKTDIHWD